jgi:hypothetical protein
MMIIIEGAPPGQAARARQLCDQSILTFTTPARPALVSGGFFDVIDDQDFHGDRFGFQSQA